MTRQQVLAARPVRNVKLETRTTESGEVCIIVPRRTDWVGKLLKLLVVIPKQREIELDAIGSDIWQLCDGEHTVGDIIEMLVDKYKLNQKEAEVSLSKYLDQLARRRLIGLAIVGEERPSSQDNKGTD